MIALLTTTAYADDGGEMGPFGGTSEGSNLPKTIDQYVDDGIAPETQFEYQEVVFLSGQPIELSGTITVEKGEVDYEANPAGTYTESYTIAATNLDGDTMNKTIDFTTSYRVIESAFKKQVVRVSTMTGWTESYSLDGNNYNLLTDQSDFSKSSVEDITPGVNYYDTVLSYNAEYNSGDDVISVTVDGNIYGYEQPWSKVETQDIHVFVDAKGSNEWQLQAHVKPYLHAKKTMYFDETEPFPISFGGTYNQRLEREATITYEVLTSSTEIAEPDKTGSMFLDTNNSVEKLPIPDGLEFIEGHWAEEDLKKLYSMEIFTEVPHAGMQFEAMNRGDFVKALCLAMNIDTSDYDEADEESPKYYGDVDYTHPNYKYIMAATDVKLVRGVGADFNVNTPVTRQEAFVIYIRVIGLERLGVSNNPVTPFVDDPMIADWAKKEIMAGYKLGIIKGDDQGMVQPLRMISKSEAAAIINRLIDYCRDEISKDYQL